MKGLSGLSVLVASAFIAGGLAVGTAAPAAADGDGCSAYFVIGIRGSDQNPSAGYADMGPTVGLYVQAAAGLLPSSDTVLEDLNFEDAPIGPDYFTSVDNGVEALTPLILSIIGGCPQTRIGLIGYSQGADVIDVTFDDFLTQDERSHIAAVLLLGNPKSAPQAGYVVSPTQDGFPGTHDGGGLLGEETVPGDIVNRTTELCIQDDPFCDNSTVDPTVEALDLAANGNIHTLYGQCCGAIDYPVVLGQAFADRLLIPAAPLPPPPSGGGGSGGGGSPPPPILTSLAGLPDGTVLQTVDTERVYKLVGGAPVWLSSCANNLCPNPQLTTQSVIDAGPAFPVNGATAQDEAGNIFKFVGGAPIHLASCAEGCGSPVRITAWSIVNYNHMRATPADGSTVIDESGDIFKFVGGAPIHLASCAEGCGSPVGITSASIATFDHMNRMPADGESVIDESGDIFKFVGGAPIHLASCAEGCGPQIGITSASIAGLDHMNAVPADGSTIIDESGDIFKFAGGAPIHLASCVMSCGTPVGITSASIAGLDHMRAMPADGTTVIDESGDVFKFAGGAPIHLASCVMGCGSWTGITSASIAGLDHMRLTPADGTTVQSETGTVYKFAGGSPLALTTCASGCGTPVGITQWSVDNRDHMNKAPAAGSFIEAVQTGALFESEGGQAVPVGQCPAAGGCSSAVAVDAASVALATGAVQSAFQANTGFLWTDGPSGSASTALGAMAGTSPAIAGLATGGFEEVFQGNTGHMFLVSAASGGVDTGLGMAAGTSPAVAALPGGGFEAAFQANTGHLFVYGSNSGPVDTGEGMMAGTSPSIAAWPGGGFEVAFQANTGHLFTWSPATGLVDVGLGMAPGTSPAVAALATGGYVTALQANTGFLWLSTPNGSIDTSLGMMAGTSPAIAAALTGGYQVAFQANTGHLFTEDSTAGSTDTGLGMMAGTSPSITTAAGTTGGYQAAIQANTGDLFTSGPSGTTDAGLGMLAGTNPATATSPTWLVQ